MSIDFNLNNYLNREIHCSCGRIHYNPIKLIDIDEGAMKRLPEHIRKLGYERIFLVTDQNIWEAAGKYAAQELENAGISFGKLILAQEEVIPDEAVIGEILTAVPMDTDLILAVGSGTLNDLCKFVSHRMGKDYMIVASAPSMDGFASLGAPLMLKHVKTTIDAHTPVAIIGDLDVLCAAPIHMIAAGLGDTLGKYTCLMDWKLSRLINDEYYCEEIVGLVEKALQTVMEQKDLVVKRNPQAIKAVTEALVLTGLAMSFAGNSRPASGCEHHFSHFWEMKALMNGRMPALHGTQVGVGMILALWLYHRLAKEEPDFEEAMKRPFDMQAWEEKMHSYYMDAADAIISLEKKAGKNDPEHRNKRLKRMKENWPLIQKMIREELPETEDMVKLLRSMSAPVEAAGMGVPAEEIHQAVEAAKEVRDRYTMLQMLWDLGLSESYAEAAEKYCGSLRESCTDEK
ncbi:MAG: sn-glycerol-1-phosphate dehydrogenase [Solobacterium sp.]|nr:sn-glycerol-1-phosphate dehydrogenase [Solobacterium sp.]